MDDTRLVARSRRTHHRDNAVVADVALLALEVEGQEGSILVHIVHLEDMVSRGEHHLRAVRQNHRLEDVHDLGDVSHLHAVGIFMEDVQRNGSDESIAECVLLEEMARRSTRFLVPPGSPFIHHKGDVLLRVVFVHDGDVPFQDHLDFEAFA